MKKSTSLTYIFLSLLLAFTGKAQITEEPSITGPGILTPQRVYAKAGENMTYSIKYGSYLATSDDKTFVRWEVNENEGEIISQEGYTPSVTIKWKKDGIIAQLKAYNIVTQTKIFNKTQNVYVATKELGEVSISAPNVAMINRNITITPNISPTPIGDISIHYSGENFVKTSESNGNVTGYFTSFGNQTITATFSGPNIVTEKTATKTITVIPNAINGVDAIAYNKTETYDILPLPSGTTCTWSVSNNLQIVSGQGTPTITVKAIGEGDAFINVSVLGLTLSKNISAGVPDIEKVSVSIGAGSNTLYFYHTNRNECRASYSGSGTILEYEWESADWDVYNPQTPNKSIVYLKAKYSSASSMANIKIRARNKAGWSTLKLIGANVSFETSGSVYKIQAVKSGIITVSKDKNQEYSLATNTNDYNQAIRYELHNQYTGILVKQGSLDSEGGTLDFSNLPNGAYVFSLIIDSTNRQTQKIIIGNK